MHNKRGAVILSSILILMFALPLLAGANKGRLSLEFDKPFQVGGKQLAAGVYVIEWKAVNNDADITFMIKGKVAADTKCKVVERDAKAESDSAIVNGGTGGPDVVKEIRLSGKKTVLVFD